VTDTGHLPPEVDVELKEDISLRGVIGSVGKVGGGIVAVAILNSAWTAAEISETVPADHPVAKLAAHLAVNEPGGEPPGAMSPIEVKEKKYYLVDSSYIVEAARRLA